MQPFVHAFRSFRKVAKGCFGYDLSPSFESDIDKFISDYGDLELGMFPKLHVLKHHVPAFCRKERQGLGLFSEQAIKSVHHFFEAKTWKNFKRSSNLPSYSKFLLSALVDFNSKRFQK